MTGLVIHALTFCLSSTAAIPALILRKSFSTGDCEERTEDGIEFARNRSNRLRVPMQPGSGFGQDSQAVLLIFDLLSDQTTLSRPSARTTKDGMSIFSCQLQQPVKVRCTHAHYAFYYCKIIENLKDINIFLFFSYLFSPKL